MPQPTNSGLLLFPLPVLHNIFSPEIQQRNRQHFQLLSLQRQLSMRTLGHFHIDERRSLTELRAILRGLLSEGLRKATKASMAEAMRAAKEAQAAAEAAAAAAQATGKFWECVSGKPLEKFMRSFLWRI